MKLVSITDGFEAVNIIKVGSKWRFKGHFVMNIFKKLEKYYKLDNELNTHIFEIDEGDEILRFLENNLIEDPFDYTIIKEKGKCDKSENLDAVAVNEKGNYKIFIMKDLASVKKHIDKEAEKCHDRALIPKL